jgi:uncharacterized protein
MNWIMPSAEGVILNIRVVPRASKSEVLGLHGDALKVRLQAPPVEGRANAALIDFLSDTLDLPARQIALLSGATGRNKRVRVQGATVGEIQGKLRLT